MALTDATLVFPKADIKDPMERIFHAPVLPYRLGETDDSTGKRGQEHALLARDYPALFAVGLDQAPTGDIGPPALHA